MMGMGQVTLLSGGIDSALLLAQTERDRDGRAGHVALHVDYGQRNQMERRAAVAIAKHCNVELRFAVLPGLADLMVSALTTPGAPLPTGDMDAGDWKTTCVPNRNMVLIAVGASLAISLGFNRVGFANHYGEGDSVYPDNRKRFCDVMGLALTFADYNELTLHVPYMGKYKAQLLVEAQANGVPFEKTWTCFAGGTRPCGSCGGCTLRAAAFASARMEDPTCSL